jgi:hypothetical protein
MYFHDPWFQLFLIDVLSFYFLSKNHFWRWLYWLQLAITKHVLYSSISTQKSVLCLINPFTSINLNIIIIEYKKREKIITIFDFLLENDTQVIEFYLLYLYLIHIRHNPNNDCLFLYHYFLKIQNIIISEL